MMAYISTEEVKAVRNLVKKNFPTKDGWKFRVYQRDHMSLKITVLKAPINLLEGEDESVLNRGYYTINRYYQDNNKSPKDKVLAKLDEIARSQDWFDKSDAMTDYFHTAYYYDVAVGDWENPFQFIEKKGYEFKPESEEVEEAQLVSEPETGVLEDSKDLPMPVDCSSDYDAYLAKNKFKKSNFRLENKFMILELKDDDLLIRDKQGNTVISAKKIGEKIGAKAKDVIVKSRLNALWFEYYYHFSASLTFDELLKINLNPELV
jgi:hypothetical protein